MSIIKNSGLRQAAVASERGWESPDGKLLIASRNLLTSRVAQGFATQQEIKTWAESVLIEIESSENKFISAIETNTARLASVSAKFDLDTSSIVHSAKTEHQLEYCQKKIEHLKVVLEYEKSFASHNAELEKLNNKKQKIQQMLNSALETLISTRSTLEKKSEEQPVQSSASSVSEKEEQSSKSVQPKKVEVQKEKKKGRFGPKPGWKKRKAEAEASARAAAVNSVEGENPTEEKNLTPV